MLRENNLIYIYKGKQPHLDLYWSGIFTNLFVSFLRRHSLTTRYDMQHT